MVVKLVEEVVDKEVYISKIVVIIAPQVLHLNEVDTPVTVPGQNAAWWPIGGGPARAGNGGGGGGWYGFA